MKHLKHGETCDPWEESMRVVRPVLRKIIAPLSHNLPWLFSSVPYLSLGQNFHWKICFPMKLIFRVLNGDQFLTWRSIFRRLIFAWTEIFADNFFHILQVFTFVDAKISRWLFFVVVRSVMLKRSTEIAGKNKFLQNHQRCTN